MKPKSESESRTKVSPCNDPGKNLLSLPVFLGGFLWWWWCNLQHNIRTHRSRIDYVQMLECTCLICLLADKLIINAVLQQDWPVGGLWPVRWPMYSSTRASACLSLTLCVCLLEWKSVVYPCGHCIFLFTSSNGFHDIMEKQHVCRAADIDTVQKTYSQLIKLCWKSTRVPPH